MRVVERKQSVGVTDRGSETSTAPPQHWMRKPGEDIWRDPYWPEHPDFHDGYTPVRAREMPRILKQPRRRNTIVVTEIDARRLRALVHEQRLHAVVSPTATLRRAERLEAELKHAAIIDARMMPGNVVTMNSSLVCEDERTGLRLSVKLVYARTAHSRGYLSVLTPLGTALLGMTVGQVVAAKEVGAAAKRLRLTALPYQPERAGDYHL